MENQFITRFILYDWSKERNGLQLISKATELGLIPKKVSCKRHPNQVMVLRRDGVSYKWRCSYADKRHKKRCNYGLSITGGTFFNNSHMSILDICLFVRYWVDDIKLCVIKSYLQLGSDHTLVDWANFCREVTFDIIYNHPEKLGEVGVKVQIDESKFGKRKNNRGGHREGQWVFGGFEENTGRTFMLPVDNRDSSTLLPIIRDCTHPGTTIISDCWKAYDCLKEHGYVHLKVNHSLHFKEISN